MEKLRKAITGKDRWSVLEEYIIVIEQNKVTNPNVALDGAKSLLESVSKTILEDKGVLYAEDSKLPYLVKKSYDALPIFAKLTEVDQESARKVLGSLENISRVVGEFRNRHGFFSHGRDLQSEKFDAYLIELAIASADLLTSFLIVAHDEDLKDRKRIYYEENDEFNKYIDEATEDYPIVMGIEISPSNALFSDIEAYKEELLTFVNMKTELIKKLEDSDTFVKTRGVCADLLPIRTYLTTSEIKQVVRAGIDNSQIYLILGHGYTRRLFTWISEERNDCLTDIECSKLGEAFAKKVY